MDYAENDSTGIRGADGGAGMSELLAGSAITEGARPLERLWSVRLPGVQIDRELNRMLLSEASNVRVPGFRRGAKVVPPAFRRQHEPRMISQLLARMAEPSLQAKIRDSGLDILPSVLIKEHSRIGSEHEVTYQFEVRPEVPEPSLEGVELPRPVPSISSADLDVVIERLRRQNAQWTPAGRPAAAGDKVRFKLAGCEEQEAELGEGLDPKVNESLAGVSAGDEVELDLSDDGASPAFKVTVSEVLEANLPELDLELARRIVPEAGSLDEFRSQISSQIERQASRLARAVLSQRVIHLLDRATAEFELPEQQIGSAVARRRDEILARAHQQGHRISAEHIDMARLSAAVRAEMRSGLVLSAFVSRHGIKAEDEAIEAFIADEAKEHAEPQQFIDFAGRDEATQQAVRREVLQGAVNDAFAGMVEVREDSMGLDQLGAAQQGADPVIAPAAESAAQEDRPSVAAAGG